MTDAPQLCPFLERLINNELFNVHRCYLKLGDWQTALEGYSEKSIPQILQYYAAATENDRNCYKVHLEFFLLKMDWQRQIS